MTGIAHLSLIPGSFDDEACIFGTLRHELFHIVLSPFDSSSSAVERVDALSAPREILDRIWNHTRETDLTDLERMYLGLTDA